MSIKRLELDTDNQLLKINGEPVEFPIEVDIYDGNYPTRMIFNGKEARIGTFFPVLLIEASTLNMATRSEFSNNRGL